MRLRFVIASLAWQMHEVRRACRAPNTASYRVDAGKLWDFILQSIHGHADERWISFWSGISIADLPHHVRHHLQTYALEAIAALERHNLPTPPRLLALLNKLRKGAPAEVPE
ncbi:MAG: hypothetical protein K8S99_11485 [Planctomycetes bacterium]|nr:hypothetical protein [Planctomycetota bacterium]